MESLRVIVVDNFRAASWEWLQGFKSCCTAALLCFHHKYFKFCVHLVHLCCCCLICILPCHSSLNGLLIMAGRENLLKHNVHTIIPYLNEECTLVILICLYPPITFFCQSSQTIISWSVQMLSFININVFFSLLVCVYFTFAVAWIFVSY